MKYSNLRLVKNPCIAALFFLVLSSGCSNNPTLTPQHGDGNVPYLSYSEVSANGQIGSKIEIAPTTLKENGSSITKCGIQPGSLNAGFFPSTLSVDPSTCVISGTPVAALPATSFSVVASNAAGISVAASVLLTINDPNASLTTVVHVDLNNPPDPNNGGLGPGQIVLTFDDGPDPIETDQILGILSTYRIKAMFNEVGANAQAYPDVTKRVLAQGHQLASHTFNHPDLATLTTTAALDEIQRGRAAVDAAAGGGFDTPFFRFPYLSEPASIINALPSLGMVYFSANFDSEDWTWTSPYPSADVQCSLAKNNLDLLGGAGCIGEFHDAYTDTPAFLPCFLDYLLNVKGYKTVVFER